MHPDYRTAWLTILRRLMFPLAALGVAAWFLFGSGNAAGIFIGLFLFLMALVFLGPALARLFAEPAGNLFWPRRTFDRPQPIYSIPQSKRLKQQPEEALAGFARIAAEYPHELRPWLEMIDIALTDLHDPDRANAIFRDGIARLKKPADKDQLARVYAATRERQDPPPARRLGLQPRHPES